MNFIETQKNSGTPVKLFYQDLGQGKPLVFIHGWPLSSKMWEYQLNELPGYGYRCIAYDRRGFGFSDKPWVAYDYDTLADDLKTILDELDLQDVTLVGFSMGGGEIARYFAKYGNHRVTKAVLISSVAGYLLQADDNPDGLPQATFDEFYDKIKEDRPAFFTTFGKQFYGVNLLNQPVSQEYLDWNLSVCMEASGKATLDCLRSFSMTDFREDVTHINVPTLIIHGDADKTVPINVTSEVVSKLIPNAQYLVYEDEPHGLFKTATQQLNTDLINFIGESVTTNYTYAGDEIQEEDLTPADVSYEGAAPGRSSGYSADGSRSYTTQDPTDLA